MNVIQEIPSTPPTEVPGNFEQPNSLTPEVMVFFITVCFLVIFGIRR